MINSKLTYISLFSSAGVGCYGFKMEDFECIATNELLEKRMNVQKYNNKCKYETGYIVGDITKEDTKTKIFDEIKKWDKLGNDKVDVVIATPPCQGMSIANHKKNENDFNRNSLVIESIKIIKSIKPRFFVFENVPAFIKTLCESLDGSPKPIGEVIKEELGKDYSYVYQTINFKNYGSNSSRTRTLVIGVCKELKEYISPIELFPSFVKEPTIREIIGHLPPLDWDDFDDNDFYHQFRPYDHRMKDWIQNTPEGCSAFDNENPLHRPHQIKNGEIIPNVRKLSGKYTRGKWNEPMACIHTRNDQLSSQYTVHPQENRVYSIRELMLFMTIPYSFKWCEHDNEYLCSLSKEEKKCILKKHEINIRQSIGEAVPTNIFRQIAFKIKNFMNQNNLKDKEIDILIKEYDLYKIDNLIHFIKNNDKYSLSSLFRIIELSNPNRTKNEAFYTNKSILTEIYKGLPNINKDTISILEPSVGIGNFLPILFKKYENKKSIDLTLVDIDERAISLLKVLLNKMKFSNVNFNFINKDFLLYETMQKYDLVIGNPPFAKIQNKIQYNTKGISQKIKHFNICSLFLEKSIYMSNYVIMILPKNILNTPEYDETRTLLQDYKIEKIIDNGENGFSNVLIETLCLFLNTKEKPNTTLVESIPMNKNYNQIQSYITDKILPYWIIYRDETFDNVFFNMNFDLFTCFRDRQITNNNTSYESSSKKIRVLFVLQFRKYLRPDTSGRCGTDQLSAGSASEIRKDEKSCADFRPRAESGFSRFL